MAKYNILPKREKELYYMDLVSSEVLDRLEAGILKIIVSQKKYKDQNYSAKKLVSDLGTNSRYLSAVLNKRFQCNYTTLVNKYRIEDAKLMLTNIRYEAVRIEDIGIMAGFSNRQSFYIAFYKSTGMTPRQYRQANLKKP